MIFFLLSCLFNDNINNNKINSNKGNFFIENCNFFRNSVYNFKGGIIYLIGNSSLNMNLITFFNCSSNDIGGCIYFNSNSFIKLDKICVFSCNSFTSHHFAYINSINNQTMNYLSILSSSKINFVISYIIENSDGNHFSTSSNYSLNFASYEWSGSGFFINQPFNLYMNFTNIINNTAPDLFTIISTIYNNNPLIEYFNIIKNNGRHRIIYTSGEIKMKNIIIFKNIHTFSLFRYYTGNLNLFNCIIFYSGTLFTTFNGVLNLNNIQTFQSLSETLTSNFTHFTTKYCDAIIPLRIIFKTKIGRASCRERVFLTV